MNHILRSIKLLNIVILSLVLNGALTVSANAASDKQPVIVQSSKSFTDTVASIKAVMKKKGVAIIYEANHQNMIAMVGGSTTPSVAIGFAKPQMGQKLLAAESLAGIEMPMKIAVREKADGKVFVVYYKPSYLFSHYNNPKLKKLGNKMDKMIGMFAKAGTK